MTGKWMNMKTMIMQLLLVLVIFCGSAEAKGIESELWGIGWDADARQVKQCMEEHGFVLLEQGLDSTGSQRQKFGNGVFADFQCDVEVVWHANSLAEINIESTDMFLLGTEFTYRNLVSRFSEEYGQPRESDGYMLKMVPGIWVEWTKWMVTDKGSPHFAVTVVQNTPQMLLGDESSEYSAKINVSFKAISGNTH